MPEAYMPHRVSLLLQSINTHVQLELGNQARTYAAYQDNSAKSPPVPLVGRLAQQRNTSRINTFAAAEKPDRCHEFIINLTTMASVPCQP